MDPLEASWLISHAYMNQNIFYWALDEKLLSKQDPIHNVSNNWEELRMSTVSWNTTLLDLPVGMLLDCT
jgi:hypothetical protein